MTINLRLFNSTHYAMLYPQNDDRFVAIDSVTSLGPMYNFIFGTISFPVVSARARPARHGIIACRCGWTLFGGGDEAGGRRLVRLGVGEVGDRVSLDKRRRHGAGRSRDGLVTAAARRVAAVIAAYR